MTEGAATGLSDRFEISEGLMSNSTAVESFPVDIDAAQVVRWLMTERAATRTALTTTVRCVTEVRKIPMRSEFHLGDEEREDLSKVATIATLEIAPMHEREQWLLTVTVEDEIGPRMASNGFDLGTEYQIDLGTFYNKFIRPRRGIANVIARADSASARAKLNYLLSVIERDQHVPERTSRSQQ
jgi:hypothetical protein